MNSIWYAFLDDYQKEIPFKPLSVILEAFYWYIQGVSSHDPAFKRNALDKVNELMK